MSKERLRQDLIMHIKKLGLSEIEIKKSVSQKELQKVLNLFKKKNWLSDDYKKNLISILFDNLHILKNKSIISLNEYYIIHI